MYFFTCSRFDLLTEKAHVFFHADDEDGRAIELFGDAAEIGVERVARGFVAQERPAVFGAEDQMDVNGGKGLWHRCENGELRRRSPIPTGLCP